ncbi:hypothetical protein DNTS_027975 [Danionella cerebrum]|uniref:BZIP domain-containing protein n=1 Tax=Danionella cerebrum TaxID=2873325 RepID=A0A553QWH5_9TELE|nr:hypothetical protein DNTS_027975 [Danionella translucida]
MNPAFLPPQSNGVLKALLEKPLKLSVHQDEGQCRLPFFTLTFTISMCFVRNCVYKLDDKYWARRRKNNMAAKRSRDARRLKENQIAIRAGFLEKENGALRQEVSELRKELGRCKNILTKYESQHGPL